VPSVTLALSGAKREALARTSGSAAGGQPKSSQSPSPQHALDVEEEGAAGIRVVRREDAPAGEGVDEVGIDRSHGGHPGGDTARRSGSSASSRFSFGAGK
jgi:hypothetical protein